MNIRFPIIVFLSLLIIGCKDEERIEDFTQPGTGSVTKFIVEAINDHGGKFDLPNEKFEIASTWRYARDGDGVQVFLRDSDFEAVARFLRKVLGSPEPESGSYAFDAALDERGGWYAVRDKGVAVSYWGGKDDSVHVIVLRPQKF